MQVAGHVLWPRAAWLYQGPTFLMVISFFIAGGLVSSKFMLYDTLCQSFLWRIHTIDLLILWHVLSTGTEVLAYQ